MIHFDIDSRYQDELVVGSAISRREGVILSVVGFVVAGQFVSAPGLEPPYYLVMVGAALLKTRQKPVTSTTATTAAPASHRTNPALSPMAPPLPLQTARRTGPSQKSV